MTYKINFLKSGEKKKLIVELEKVYGITKIPHLLLETGRKKIRAFSGHLSKEEIQQLSDLVNVEIVGTYLINKRDDDLRISFDALPIMQKQITKRILEIDKKQFEKWMRGYNLPVEKIPRGIVILKFKDELVGIGKSNEEKIFNYVPKERKLKTPLPAD